MAQPFQLSGFAGADQLNQAIANNRERAAQQGVGGHFSTGNDKRDFERNQVQGQGEAAAGFAGIGEQGFGQTGQRIGTLADMLQRRAMGQDSLSAEQLRQGLQQNLAAQQSMAASASPANAAMAARTAAIQSGRLGSALAGQQATAGIQERAHAQNALGQLLAQKRQQDLAAALQSRQNALAGFGDIYGTEMNRRNLEFAQPSTGDKLLGAAVGLGTAGIAAYGNKA